MLENFILNWEEILEVWRNGLFYSKALTITYLIIPFMLTGCVVIMEREYS